MIEIILTIMIILFIIGYFKSCYKIDEEKQSGILWIFLMTFLFSISILLNFVLIEQNNKLIEKTKNKCPEYEEIHEVYIIKKK